MEDSRDGIQPFVFCEMEKAVEYCVEQLCDSMRDEADSLNVDELKKVLKFDSVATNDGKYFICYTIIREGEFYSSHDFVDHFIDEFLIE